MARQPRSLDVGSVLRNALALRQFESDEATRTLQRRELSRQNALAEKRREFAPAALEGDPEARRALAAADPDFALRIEDALSKMSERQLNAVTARATGVKNAIDFIEASDDPAQAYQAALPGLQTATPDVELPPEFTPDVLDTLKAGVAPFVKVMREPDIRNVQGVGAVAIDPVTRKAQTIVAARPAPERFKPQSDIGKALADRQQFARTYGADSPQVAAIDEAIADEKRGGAPKLSDVAGLRKEFTKQSQNFIGSRSALEKIDAAGDTAAGDLSLMFGFMKALDPTSVVRESEFATVAQSGSLGQRLQAGVQRVLSGERLTPAQRDSFKNEARQAVLAQLPSQQRLMGSFTDIAVRQGMDPENVVIDFTEGLEISPEAPTGPQGGQTVRQPTPAAPTGPAQAGALQAAPQDDGGTPAAGLPDGTEAEDGAGNRMVVRGGVWVPMQ